MFAPGHCMICGGAEGEMIDTHVDFGGYRHYICVRLCAPLIAKALGETEPVLCTHTKKNGEPCTARRLPGRDVCVAHAKPAKVLQEA